MTQKRDLSKKAGEPTLKKPKPTLASGWTRTDPHTGDLGRLQRKDTNYLMHYKRRRRYIDRKKKERRYAKEQAELKKQVEKDEKAKKRNSKSPSTGTKPKPKTKTATPSKKAPAASPKKKSDAPSDIDDEDDEDDKSDPSEIVFATQCQRYKKNVVVIFGGGRNVGEACALRFAQEGAIVYVLDRQRWVDTKLLIRQHCGKKIRFVGAKCDVTDLKQVKDCLADIVKQTGYIDVIVNAVNFQGSKVLTEKTTVSEASKIMNLNFLGTFNTCKAVLPYMKKEGYGRIVNLASGFGVTGKAMRALFCASQAAIIAFTKSLAKENAKSGVLVNCVAPSFVVKNTSSVTKAQGNKLASCLPMGRVCHLDEIAMVVAYAACEENQYTTGFVYDCSGGLL